MIRSFALNRADEYSSSQRHYFVIYKYYKHLYIPFDVCRSTTLITHFCMFCMILVIFVLCSRDVVRSAVLKGLKAFCALLDHTRFWV